MYMRIKGIWAECFGADVCKVFNRTDHCLSLFGEYSDEKFERQYSIEASRECTVESHQDGIVYRGVKYGLAVVRS